MNYTLERIPLRKVLYNLEKLLTGPVSQWLLEHRCKLILDNQYSYSQPIILLIVTHCPQSSIVLSCGYCRELFRAWQRREKLNSYPERVLMALTLESSFFLDLLSCVFCVHVAQFGNRIYLNSTYLLGMVIILLFSMIPSHV